MKFKVEKGIDIPQINVGGEGRSHLEKYPFLDLEVGDSFIVPLTGNKAANFRCLVAKKNSSPDGRRYTTRTVDGGIRVWRIA